MRHYARAHHWVWLSAALVATLLCARVVQTRMISAARDELASDCDNLDRTIRRQFDEPVREFHAVLGHTESGNDLAARRHATDETLNLESLWLWREGEQPELYWRRAPAPVCGLPADPMIGRAADSLGDGSTGWVVPIESDGCGSCVWLLAMERASGRLVLCEADLDEAIGILSEHLSNFATGHVSLRFGGHAADLIGVSSPHPIDSQLRERREVAILGGRAAVIYDVRGFASAWSELRPLVNLAVLTLGVSVAVLGFIALRALSASTRREDRLRRLTDELHARDRDIQRRRAQAEAASAAKSALLRRTSHNIRSPLTSILGHTESLLTTSAPGPSQESLQAVRASARHLLDLANGLLDIARAESGRITTSATDVDPDELLREVVDGFRSLADEKGITLGVAWENSPPAALRLDPTRLREVLINLLDNAIRHTAKGGVSVAARTDTATGKLHLDVIDTGEGIEPERLGSLLRADEGLTVDGPDHAPHGMGLAITHHVVGAMGGSLEITSRPGVGTVCTVSLPAAPIRASSGGEAPETGPGPRHGAEHRAAEALVVDDSVEVRQFMRLKLASAGIDAHVVESGSAARDAVSRPDAAYRIVFLDRHLRDADGVSLLGELRGALRSAQFVVLTGDTGDDAERRYLDAGFDAYLPKPFTREQLRGVLARAGWDLDRRAA